MIAAERHPLDFDGVIAGDPAFHLSSATVPANYSRGIYTGIAPKTAAGLKFTPTALTASGMKVLANGVLKQCDALDGQKDSLIFNQAACHFDPATVECGTAPDGQCSAPVKVAAIRTAFRGPRSLDDKALASSWVYNAGVLGVNWRE